MCNSCRSRKLFTFYHPVALFLNEPAITAVINERDGHSSPVGVNA